MPSFRKELATVVANTTKAQNIDLFADDFRLKHPGDLLRITIQASANITALKLVPNTGTAIGLGGLTASVQTTFTLAVDHGRTWNIQTADAGGITVHHCVVQEVNE